MDKEYYGFLVALTLTIAIILKSLNLIKEFIYNLFNLMISFTKHIWSLKWVLMSLFILYKVFEKIDENMLPNIITIVITVVIIDYLMKTREESSKKNIINFFNNDMNVLKTEIEELLKVVLEVDSLKKINRSLIEESIFSMNFEDKEIKYKYIEDNKIKTIDVCKLDYIHYKLQEVNFRIQHIYIDYRHFVNDDNNKLIINLRKLLDKKILKIPLSKVNVKSDEDITAIKLKIIDIIDILYKYYKKLKF